jgi:hypothetical protein
MTVVIVSQGGGTALHVRAIPNGARSTASSIRPETDEADRLMTADLATTSMR